MIRLARVATLALALTAWAGLDDAYAQQVPDDDAAAPPVDAVPSPVPSPGPDPRDDDAWRLYHEAFAALARDDRAAARAAIGELTRRYPDHPATAQAALGLDVAPPAPGGTKAGREQRSQSARAELALFQAFHGIAVGVELCVVAECDEGASYVALALLGGSVGAVASLQAHPTSGQRALINSGAVWGTFNAAMLLIATEPDDDSTVGLMLIGGQAAGVGLALALSAHAPTAGQVALANSGGQWSLALTGLSLAAADVELDDQQLGFTLAIVADAGIGVGSYLVSTRPRISRAQTLVIDAAGIVGAVAGGAGGVMITGDVEDRSTAGLAALGAALGLGTAAYFTRHWDDEDDDGPPITATITPVRGGGGLVSAHLVW